jgi:hypothetical protein
MQNFKVSRTVGMAADRVFFRRILPILVSRAVFFFFLMCFLTVFLYAIGTVQGFMDSTQIMLLKIAAPLGLFLAAGAVYGIVLDFILFFGLKKIRFLGGAGLYLVMGIFGAVTALGAFFITAAAGGNGL